MFKGALLFNQPLNNWDVSSVTKMETMFFQLLRLIKILEIGM